MLSHIPKPLVSQILFANVVILEKQSHLRLIIEPDIQYEEACPASTHRIRLEPLIWTLVLFLKIVPK